MTQDDTTIRTIDFISIDMSFCIVVFLSIIVFDTPVSKGKNKHFVAENAHSQALSHEFICHQDRNDVRLIRLSTMQGNIKAEM